jgi:hypothetical protein
VMDRPRSLARSLAAACALSFTHLLAMFMVWFNACPECTLATSNVGIALIAAMATPWFALSLGRLGFHPDARGLWKGVLVGTLGAGAIFAPLVAIGDLIGEGVVLASMVVLGGAWVGWTSRQALESRWHLTTGAVLLQVLFISMCFFGAGGQDAGGVLLLPFLAFSGWILWRSRLRPSEVVLDDAA